MTDNDLQGVIAARERVHKLSGLLSGMSAGLYVARASEDVGYIRQCLSEIVTLVEEAGQELGDLRSILHSLS